jgi:hypothetical protein
LFVPGYSLNVTGVADLSASAGQDSQTIALIVVGGVLLVLGAGNEIHTKRSPIVPPRLFKTRTTAIILIITFFHAVAFFAGMKSVYLAYI